jgi:hypothetical protein
MKRRAPKHVLGTFLSIPLADGSFAYGRELENPYTAFYNYRTTEPSSDMDVIASKPLLDATRALFQSKGISGITLTLR